MRGLELCGVRGLVHCQEVHLVEENSGVNHKYIWTDQLKGTCSKSSGEIM